MIRSLIAIPLTALALVHGGANAVDAQVAAVRVSSTTWGASRDEIESAASRYDRLAASTAYGERLRAVARAEAGALRQRLTDGDFQVGDRILLRVEGQVMIDDTVTVMEGRRITVRGIRQVALTGVLRSELEIKLRAELTEVVRNVTLSASPLMRVAVFGSVVRPGYIGVPSSTRLDQVLMLAGGPVANAAVDNITVVRADTVILDRERIVAAVASGATLDDLGIRNGDQVLVPPQGPPWDRSAVLQIVSIFLFPLLTIFVINQP